MSFAIMRVTFILKSELFSPDCAENEKINIIRNTEKESGINAIFLFAINLRSLRSVIPTTTAGDYIQAMTSAAYPIH